MQKRVNKAVFRLALLGLASLPAAVGCGPGRADLVGRVTYRDRPLACGTVLVVGSDGLPRSAPIAADGSYRVDGVAYGPARIGVASPDPAAAYRQMVAVQKSADQAGKLLKPDPESVRKWFPIPPGAQDPDSSGLKCTIDAAVTPHDLRLD